MNAWMKTVSQWCICSKATTCLLFISWTNIEKGKPLDDDMLLRFCFSFIDYQRLFNEDYIVLDVHLVGNWSSLQVMMKLNKVHNQFLQVRKHQKRKLIFDRWNVYIFLLIHSSYPSARTSRWTVSVRLHFFPSHVFISIVWSGLSSTSASLQINAAHAELFNSIYD